MKKNKKKDKKSKQKDFDFFKYCMKYANCRLCPKNGKGVCKWLITEYMEIIDSLAGNY